MNSDRIKKLQEQTAFPDSVSVRQALLQVWNECQQENNIELAALRKENEILKSCLNESFEIIEFAINGTPSGIVRNTLTDKNIYIQIKSKNLLKP